MQLTLEAITKQVGPATWLHEMNIAPHAGAVTVLLGATQAGKTSLMRVMAGLDVPSSGRVKVDGQDVTGMPVRERNVAMVYQQFINYPSMTVFDNIASPLKLRGEPGVEKRVHELAARLHIEPFLDRLPAALSGGQQQRVALARALAKAAPLMLLDEPLVNLDYKLREELREELTQLFASGDSTVIYATTEPGEALLLGGWTAVLDAGELLQYGPTADVFHTPASLRVARAFSDPPMNLIAADAVNLGVQLHMAPGRATPDDPPRGGDAAGDSGARQAGPELSIPLPAAASKALTIGIRAGALRLNPRPGDVALAGRVELAEISGSDTFVHVETPIGELVAQLSGVHFFALGAPITLHLAPSQAYVFDAQGALLVAPPRRN
jgi:glycerol transport system ATP-binding protein